MSIAVLERFAGIVGSRHVLTEPADTAAYTTDWRRRYSGTPLCVLQPSSTNELAEVVRVCSENALPMVPQGGNTGLCGGATPCGGEVLINLQRLNRIRWIDAVDNTICVEAGVALAEVQVAASNSGRLFPLSLAAEGSATIGGNLSTNAGGVQVLRYGNMRDLTLGLEVVLADGSIWNGLRRLRKDNTGYDLKQLFIGAEGTLGFIAAATLKLFPARAEAATAWVAVTCPASAIALLGIARDAFSDELTACELIGANALGLVLQNIPGARSPLPEVSDWYLLIELSGHRAGLAEVLADLLATAQAQGLVTDAAVATNQTQVGALWALRENISEAQRIAGPSIKHDIAVPVSRIPEFIERADAALLAEFPGMRIVCFGHIGDGNLHYNQSSSNDLVNDEFLRQTTSINRIVYDIVSELDGTISAEHGLGQLKRADVRRMKSETEMKLMASVKRALDPAGLMNPGKVL
jgi:FAD/FMN-containing dehydrogenase